MPTPAALREFLLATYRAVGGQALARARVFDALGLLGDGALVDELVPRILAWREQGNYRRVKACARRAGGDGA